MVLETSRPAAKTAAVGRPARRSKTGVFLREVPGPGGCQEAGPAALLPGGNCQNKNPELIAEVPEPGQNLVTHQDPAVNQ